MKYGIDMGHNAPPDTGIRGLRFEDDLTLEVGLKIVEKLEALGHGVVNCTPQRARTVLHSLGQRVARANEGTVDYLVSIHFDGGGGDRQGVQVAYGCEAGKGLGAPILKELGALGFVDRGLVAEPDLYLLKNTTMTAIEVRCGFVDHPGDMARYNPELMSNAIVKGLTGQLPPLAQLPGDGTVKRLQGILNQLHMGDHHQRPLVEDGLWGPATAFAIAQIQKILGFPPSQKADGPLLTVLEEILAKPLLQRGDRRRVVRYLQHRLDLAIDGDYGPKTETAVRRYQRENHLLIDGVVGDEVWDTLFTPMAIGSADSDASTVPQPPDSLDEPPTILTSPLSAKDIATLQGQLNRLQVPKNADPLGEDGQWSQELLDALHHFQKVVGLPLTGTRDQPTQTAIASILGQPLLQPYQSRGRVVRYVQYRLGIAIDGDYGPKTAAAVRAYQQHHGLIIDGVVGNQLWGQLLHHQQTSKPGGIFLPGYEEPVYLNEPIVGSGHFYWSEALHGGQRIPSVKTDVDNIIRLANQLEDVRDRLGGYALSITSWYRPEPWNSRVGGARSSRHKIGEAVDILHPRFGGLDMARRLQDWPGGMGIYGHYPRLLHLDVRPYRARWGGA